MTKQYGHTRGDLYVDDSQPDGSISIKGEECGRVVAILPTDSRMERKTAQVNAERLVTCWNELEGIPTHLISAFVAAGRKALLNKEKQQ